ncbi:YcaO-like family protein [Pseudodesulfovibrio tunisiensis]|uniref:YcaO-like family protein n=1 Tax=Pseudodesulfovibrio tunisiensis TaxID=463192 RepID=UPI001FB352CC|nr:YcaO-like family protein [Pseudodesulfovibrio tunisiensis]
MRYKLQLMDTNFGVGMFAADPAPNLSFNEMIDHLRQHPFDTYMHEFVLRKFGDFRTRKLAKLIKDVMRDNCESDPILGAILYEAVISHQRHAELLPLFDGVDPNFLAEHTPTIHIRSRMVDGQSLHRQWTRIFADNLFDHAPLPAPDQTGLAPLFAEKELDSLAPVTAADVLARLKDKLPAPNPRRPLQETISHATEVLEKADAFLGPAMEHRASLSPVARLRHWMVKTRVDNGNLSNSLEGLQTCYGRGLDSDTAEASYLMELAERFSSYASVGNKGILNRTREYPLTLAAHGELEQEAVNPADIRLEVPYAGQRIHWFEGHGPDQDGNIRPILVPAQFVFLFCNLDEPSLFSALGSTGLASGNTLAEAKVSGLTEVMERDCDATIPFDPTRCFTVTTDDPTINKLMFNYHMQNIHAWFQDMTPEYGVPCYKAFVTGPHGDVNKGTGCDLNGKRALISAMTETAYPCPGPPSAPVPEGLPIRRLEDLPDLSAGSAEGDLMILEHTLLANNLSPAYADLTRRDLNIPVVRAMVPGLELIADFDQYSRVSPRLFRNYLNMFRE